MPGSFASPMRFGTLLILLSFVSEAATAASPADFLPPAPPWSGASEALIVPPDHPWITPVERSGMTDTPSYDETIAWLRKLAAASPLIKVMVFGQTAEGRELCAVIATKEGIERSADCPAPANRPCWCNAAFMPARSTARTPA